MFWKRETLQELRKVVEAGWTQGCLARDKEDNECNVTAPHAEKFCLFGAIIKVADCSFEKEQYLHHTLCTTINPPSILQFRLTRWNDDESMNQQKVLEVIDKALTNID